MTQARGDCGNAVTERSVVPLAGILAQADDITGKTGEIQIRSRVELVITDQCQFLSVGQGTVAGRDVNKGTRGEGLLGPLCAIFVTSL